MAQQKVFHGKVTDSKTQAPLQGATVTVQGKSNGTVTDENGNFSIEAASGGDLIIGSVGYASEKIHLGESTDLDVHLNVTAASLDDIVVVGYGTRKKKDLTGSVGSVKIENTPLAILPNVNALDAIKGTVAGFNVGVTTNAGGNPDISIRGQNSIRASTYPLIVLDGVIYTGSFNEINPNDIATVDVLKDAAATAIYGSQGSTGVVLITTKKGKSGKPVINMRATSGYQTYTRKPDMRNGPEFIQYRHDVQQMRGASPSDLEINRLLSGKELQAYNEGHTINWWDVVVKPAPFQDYQLNFSGGNDRFNFYVSGDYLDQKGIVYNDNFKKFTVLSKIEAKITDWMKYGLTLSVSSKNADGVAADLEKGTINAPYGYMYSTFPGYENWLERYPQSSTTTFNPLWRTQAYDEDRNQNYRSLNYVRVDAPWVKGLSYTFNYSLNRWEGHGATFNDERTFVNTLSLSELQDQTKYLPSVNGSRSNSERTDWYLSHILNYSQTFNDHAIDVTLLAERQDIKNRSLTLSATDFSQAGTTVLGVNSLELGDPTKRNVNTGDNQQDKLAYLARVNYVYKNRYYLSGSIREDGNSVLAEGHKYGVFKALSAAYAISEEDFFQKRFPLVNFLKLRASYGETGNPSITPYGTISGISTSNYLFGTTPANTIYPNNLANKALKWEKTSGLDFGVDFGIWKNIISGTIDYYNTDTKDLLLNRFIPVMNGFTGVLDNIGKVHNWGVEVQLRSQNLSTKNFSWSSGLNFWINRNKVVSLYGLDGNKDGKEDDDVANNLFIGKSLGAVYDLTFNGIVQTGDTAYQRIYNAKPGDIKFKDLDSNGKIDANDRSVIGFTKPNYTLSLSNTFKYKNFELYFMVSTIQGGGKDNYYIASNQYALNPNTLFATVANWLNKDYWMPDRPSNTIPRPDYNNQYGYKFTTRHDFYRLQDLSLSYTFGNKLLGRTPFKNVKAYIAGENLVTLSDWEGLDPETATTYASVNGFPVMKTVTVGLSITF
ncbi:MAG: SusC/RagA family TonB-linked outer membrane protein [Flavisolibacter sp.]